MSQRKQILQHLKTGRSITALEALELFGCFRLAARIAELREAGHQIKTLTDDDGFNKRWAVYIYIGGPKT